LDPSLREPSGQEKHNDLSPSDGPHSSDFSTPESPSDLVVTLSDSSLSAGELAEFRQLMEKQDRGELIDADRLYELDLLERFQSGEPFDSEETRDLQMILMNRRRTRAYRKEFFILLDRCDKGEEVDQDRLYFLELKERRRVGEILSELENRDLQEFEAEEQDRLMRDSSSDHGSEGMKTSQLFSSSGEVQAVPSDSSLSSAELEELNDLLEQQETGAVMDSERLYNLDLFDKFMSGEPLDMKEQKDLEIFRERRRIERSYRKEFLVLFGRSKQG